MTFRSFIGAKLFPIVIIGCLILAIFSIFSCSPNNECNDIDYGRQYLLDEPISPYPYKGKEKLIFKNPLGHELTFNMLPHFNVSHDWLEYAQPLEDGPCVGESKILSELEYYLVNLNSDSLDYKMICHYYVIPLLVGDKPIYSDIILSSIIQGSNSPVDWSITLSHRVNTRGNDAYFSTNPPEYIFEEHRTLGTTEFENVYSLLKSDGSELHFNHTLGFIAFKERNKPMWILDRIE